MRRRLLRQNQRHPGQVRLQHQEAHQSFPFLAFQRAVQGHRSKPDALAGGLTPAVSGYLRPFTDFSGTTS